MLYTVYLLTLQECEEDIPRPIAVFAKEEDAHLFAEQHLLSGTRIANVSEIDYLGNPP